MSGFQKIEVAPSVEQEAPQASASEDESASFLTKRKIAVLAVVALVVLSGAIIFVLAQRTYASARQSYHQAKLVLDAVKKQNIQLAKEELDKTEKELKTTQKNLRTLSFIGFVPLLSWYYSDAEHLLNASFRGVFFTRILIESLHPYADVLGLKGEGSFVGGTAEQRIQTVVLTMGKVTPRIDDIAKELLLAKKEVDKVSPSHYPAFLGLGRVHKQLVAFQRLTDQGVTLVDEARPLIKVLPTLLGETKGKKYLVLFQNDKELRATGGFITAYAIFRIDKGIIHVDASDDIYSLDNSLRKRGKAPEPILKYLPKVRTFNLRDSNLSADYVDSMKTFAALYQDASRKVDVDGIIALDTHVLVSTIKILDDEVFAGGIKFTTKTDKRCDCPQVIYTLEELISRPVGYERAGRKDIIGVLLFAIMEKALQSSPKKYWGPLVQELLTQVNEKHVLFYLFDEQAQAGVEALNAAGRIKPFEGDYLHVNNTNFAGAKANLYVKESVVQEIDIGSDGTITKTLTLSYKNSYPPSNCDLEAGQLCLNAPLRNWLRILVPKGTTMVKSQGSEVKMKSYEELDKTVFEGFFTVKPQGSSTFTITYSLPFKLKKGSPLPLLIQKQPGTDRNQYILKVNGREIEKFELLTDREIKLEDPR